MTEGDAGQQGAGGDAGQGSAGTGGAAGTGDGSATGSNQDGAGGGGGGEHWLSGVAEGTFDERDTGILQRFGTVGDLAKGYMNAFNLVSRDKIPMPQNEQEFEEVYNRLGRPETHDGYEFSFPDGFPQDIAKAMEGNQGWFKEAAHKAGLNKTQAANLYSAYAQLVQGRTKAESDRITSEMDSARVSLKTELGEAYEGKMVLANRAISEVGGEDLIKLFEDNGMGRNPVVVKAFIKIGEMLAEEAGLDIEGTTTDSKESLDAQIAEIQANPAYMDAKAPEHKVLVAKMQKLMAKRHPEEQHPAGTIKLF